MRGKGCGGQGRRFSLRALRNLDTLPFSVVLSSLIELTTLLPPAIAALGGSLLRRSPVPCGDDFDDKPKKQSHGPRFHACGTLGGDRHHRHAGRPAVAGGSGGSRSRATQFV